MLEAIICIALVGGGFAGGFWVASHVHAVADKAVKAVQDAVNKV
jgi:hypothetical protein